MTNKQKLLISHYKAREKAELDQWLYVVTDRGDLFILTPRSLSSKSRRVAVHLTNEDSQS